MVVVGGSIIQREKKQQPPGPACYSFLPFLLGRISPRPSLGPPPCALLPCRRLALTLAPFVSPAWGGRV